MGVFDQGVEKMESETSACQKIKLVEDHTS